jgi:signal transduction histidine kinase
VLDTAVTLAAAIVAVLAGVRFSVEGRRLDFLLCGGFFLAAASTFAFSVAPVFGGGTVGTNEAWAGIAGKLLATGLIAAAPFTHSRIFGRQRVLRWSIAALVCLGVALWLLVRSRSVGLPELHSGEEQPLLLIFTLALQAFLSLVALVGFGLRFRAYGDDLYRWLGLAVTLALFAELHYVFTPVVSSSFVSQGDFLRLISYGVLMAGVWRAIRFAEFGRAVAEERARVAREIHDGLAQYLFTVSTHASMLESGNAPEGTVKQIKEAAAAAQQEARFAILALSSASGNAPFDAALRRYVDFLTADGELEVDLEVDPALTLAPDEQIEVFRIVQEGLANVRKHAHARRAEVLIGQRGGERFVIVRDDGAGFNGDTDPAGQGIKNLRQRAASIGGAFSLRSAPGEGTALEVILRA